jgi:hypothetical protein
MTRHTAPTTLPATQNEDWGFYGTMRDQAATAWPLAIQAVADATGETVDAAQAFLDSVHGRHFADSVINAIYTGSTLPAAIAISTGQWMACKVKKSTHARYGIPLGIPYLTGLVVRAEMHAEDATA